MNKTEAAKAMALQVTVFASKYQQPVTKMAVAEHLSECHNGHRGSYLAEAAQTANIKTVTKLVREMLTQQGDYQLVAF